uniref:Peroxidasin n=1 Tax=Cacopsylla melanoneura TaxID=428564 RepID=A0A8D8Z3T8_9HEMI
MNRLLTVCFATGSEDCTSTQYRSYDGTCNNVRHSEWGASGTAYLRLIPGDYKNLITSPSGKEISHRIKTSPQPHDYLSNFVGLWSQLIQDDLSFVNTTAAKKIINQATGFLDGSSLYATNSVLKRTQYGALLECVDCASVANPLYKLFVLEHNRLVSALAAINPDWSEDVLFEEARSIVVAQIQHVTYDEYLPVLIGESNIQEWGLRSQKAGFYHGYSSNNKPGTFASVAFTILQVLPTMVPATLRQNIDVDNLLESVRLILRERSEKPNISPEQMIRLIEESRRAQIVKYSAWAEFCSPRDASELVENIPLRNQNVLRETYKNIDSVDLLIGGLLENSEPGSALGNTFSCLLARQFSVLKDSDRFWYENDLPPTSFSIDQLNSIRQISLSSILCENIPSVETVQPKAFLQSDAYLNAPIRCSHLSRLNLTHWQSSSQSTLPIVTKEVIDEALQRARADLRERQTLEHNSFRISVDPGSPSGIAAAFSKPTAEALRVSNNSIFYEYATRELVKTLKDHQTNKRIWKRQALLDNSLDPIGIEFIDDLNKAGFLPPIGLQNQPSCPAEPCDPSSPFRTISGRCNNLVHTEYGRSLTTFSRLLPSVYEDLISAPRAHSVTGAPLPTARLVSAMVHADISHLSSRYSLMVMQVAQIVDHDLTFTPVYRGFFTSIPDCRSCDSRITVHPECMPIQIPPGDPYFPQINVTSGRPLCMPFMRSLSGQQGFGPREQLNQNSAFLDASLIYGEHACGARDLRAFDGKLNVTVMPDRKDLLPNTPSHPECRSRYCFVAGDGRASEQPGLTAIHTILMREHNRMAEQLAQINPHWNDEQLFQQTRRIMVAQWQHVVYNELLPRLLGLNAVNLYGLKLSATGYYKGYNDQCRPNIMAEFATAAYRIGHSMLRPFIPRLGPNFEPLSDGHVLLRNHFFNPDIIYKTGMIDEMMRGLSATPMEDLDQFITGEITNHLFEEKGKPHSGIDLPALNVQRARDHGVASYNEYRVLCNLKKATTWADFSREIPDEVIARFRRIYASPDDVDLFPGGLSERPVAGGLVGPTFACIIGLQFRQLRKCDRFWYETDDPVIRFTEPQLQEIRKSTLAKIICANMDFPAALQKNVLELPNDFTNVRLPCHLHPEINLNLWKQTGQSGCNIGGVQVGVGQSHLPTPCTSCICTSEGPQCASLRVTDCPQLLREAGKDSVVRDDICMAQCSNFVLEPSGLEDSLSFQSIPPPPSSVFSSARGLPDDLVPPPPRSRSAKRISFSDIASAVFG